MKKTALLLALLLLCLALPGCGEGQSGTAYTLYLEVGENFAALTSVEAEINCTLTTPTGDGAHTTEEIFAAARIIRRDEAGPDMVLTVDAPGQAYTFYFTGGYAYANMMGFRYKYPARPTEILASANANLQLPPEAVKKAAVKSTDNGWLLTFTLDGVAWDQAATGLPSALLLSQAGLEPEPVFSDFTYELSVDGEKQLLSSCLSYSVSAGTGSEAATALCEMTTVYRNRNGVRFISFPDDLHTYSERKF